MALKKCIYCSSEISEYAKSCPKCRRTNPFDQKAKDLEAARAAEAKSKKAVNAEKAKIFLESRYKAKQTPIFCPECHYQTTFENWKGSECPECGYPGFFNPCIKCNKPATVYDHTQRAMVCTQHYDKTCPKCDKPATVYDSIQEVFVCDEHLVEKCNRCGKLIYEDKQIEFRSVHRTCAGTFDQKYVYHKSCTDVVVSKTKKRWWEL